MDNNNFSNGYPQQPQGGQPYGYQQQPQMQQPYGYQQQPQMGQPYGYPQQPPKKSKSKAVIGVIIGIAVVAVIAVVLVLVLKGGVKGGYDSPEDVVEAYWEAFSDCDEDKMGKCFPSNAENFDDIVDDNISNAENMKSTIDIHHSDISIDVSSCDDEDEVIERLENDNYKVKDVKYCYVEVPLTQTIAGLDYEVIDCYDVIVVKLNNDKWFIYELTEVDAYIVYE